MFMDFPESSNKLYMDAISEISSGIAKGILTGTEDSLLATVIWLCVYEVCKHSQLSRYANY